MQASFRFKKDTPEIIIEKAETLLGGLEEFSTSINRKILDLEKGYDLLYLASEMGTREFRKMIKAKFPYTYGDILNQMTVAQLHRRLPQFHEKLLSLGASACKELVKASDSLVCKVLATTATTLAEIKKIINREKKGFAIAPTSEQVQQMNIGTIVEVTKVAPKVRGWLAEVTEEPDEFGRLSVRLLKTGRKRQFFVDEVRVYVHQSNVDPDKALAAEDWESLRIQYDLSESDFGSIEELAYRNAQQEASVEATSIHILWKHVTQALDSCELKPKFSEAATSGNSDSEPSEKTYTLAEVQASIEAAQCFARSECKAQLEAEWLEKERIWVESNRQLEEKLNSRHQIEYELTINRNELRELAIENDSLRTKLLLLQSSPIPAESSNDLEQMVTTLPVDAERTATDLPVAERTATDLPVVERTAAEVTDSLQSEISSALPVEMVESELASSATISVEQSTELVREESVNGSGSLQHNNDKHLEADVEEWLKSSNQESIDWSKSVLEVARDIAAQGAA